MRGHQITGGLVKNTNHLSVDYLSLQQEAHAIPNFRAILLSAKRQHLENPAETHHIDHTTWHLSDLFAYPFQAKMMDKVSHMSHSDYTGIYLLLLCKS